MLCRGTRRLWSRNVIREKRFYWDKMFQKGEFWDKFLLFTSDSVCSTLLWQPKPPKTSPGGKGTGWLHCCRVSGGSKVENPRYQANKDTYLFHFYSPHWAADINDKEDVFGNWVHVFRSKKVDKISIKYLKNRTYLWAKPLPMFGM